jgi:shikimate kinase/3-dehydroquinate synthase
MDVVLVGLSGSGKSVIGRRLAAGHGATFVDLDEAIEARAGRSIPEIFAADGETVFRALEREVIAALGPPGGADRIERVIATGGGAVVDPRNRWILYRRRLPVWIDGPVEVLAARLRRSRHVRPLVAGSRDPVKALRALLADRERFYAPAIRVDGTAGVGPVLRRIEAAVAARLARSSAAERGEDPDPDGTTAATMVPGGTLLLDARTRIGRIVLGEAMAAEVLADVLGGLRARRAILISEPGAWAAVGAGIAERLAAAGWLIESILLPRGEAAKRLAVVGRAARRLAALRVERGEPLVAIGGGALGDAAGFLAAVWLRGVPIVHVPTTLVAQIDSSIGGKTAVDLPEGKNLLGAFHQPVAVVIDVAALRSLPVRQRRAALAEAVKMAVLGDDRLFELLETDGPAIARGEPWVFEAGVVAELVERAAWAKVEVVLADERETGARISLNLGHSVGHGIEAAAGYRGILHGEAVAWGLRAACRIGVALDVTPAERAARIEALLDRLGLGLGRAPVEREAVLAAMARDKKHELGRLRWVLPADAGYEVRRDVPEPLVRRVVDALVGGRPGGTRVAPGRRVGAPARRVAAASPTAVEG